MPESTEKLLHILREGSREGRLPSSVPHSGESPSASDALKTFRLRMPRLGSGRSRRLGVDISPRGLQLVLTSDSSPRSSLLGYRHVPYPDGTEPGTAAFPAFLRREVRSLCGRTDDLQIWSHVFSARAQLQHVLVPKVPPWELYDLVFWKVKKDNPFDEKEFLLDLEIQGQVMDKGIPKLNVLCCLAPRRELAEARTHFVEAGLPLAGMTFASLALEGIFRKSVMRIKASSFATLHIGRDWSRIDIFDQNNLVLSRVVKTGLHSMAEVLSQAWNERFAAPAPQPLQSHAEEESLAVPEVETLIVLEPETSANPTDQHAAESASPEIRFNDDVLPPSVDGQNMDTARNDLTGSTPSRLNTAQGLDVLLHALVDRDKTPPTGVQLSEDQAIKIILPVCARLARQVERTFDHSVREQRHERAQVLLLSGDLSVNQKMCDYFQNALGVPTLVLDPLDPALSPHWRSVTPANPLERVRHNLALALALCDEKQGLNLQKTFRQREDARSVTRVNMAIYAVTIVLLLTMTLAYGIQGRVLDARTNDLAQLDRELANFVPRLSGDNLQESAAQIRQRQEELRGLSSRLQVLAMLREISALTPEHIRLYNLRIDSGPRSQVGRATAPGTSSPGTSGKALVMDGTIVGDPRGFETALSIFIISLQRSMLFEVPQVHDKRMETTPDGEERMRFALHVPTAKAEDGQRQASTTVPNITIRPAAQDRNSQG